MSVPVTRADLRRSSKRARKRRVAEYIERVGELHDGGSSPAVIAKATQTTVAAVNLALEANRGGGGSR